MRRLVSSIAFAGLFAGCLLYPDGGEGKNPCMVGDRLAGDDVSEAEPAPLRNPTDLTCQSFGGGGECDPRCGPCPLATANADLAPLPSWGSCFSSCEGLSESSCAANDACRVVKDADCMISLACETDYLGCFPTDNFQEPAADCFAIQDGESCSRSSGCTALHRNEPCGFVGEGASDAVCPRPFAMCVPEGRSPGRCAEPVTCDAVGPDCRSGTVPGIENGCFTGACIPTELCGPPS